MRFIRSHIGLKVAAVLGLLMLAAAAAVIAVSRHYAETLGYRAADRSAQALRQQAFGDLRHVTAAQAERYSTEFERNRVLSRLLATEAEALLARPVSEPSPLDLSARKDMLTNSPEATASLVFWEDTDPDAACRREMARLRRLDPLLQRVRREGFSTEAAWFASADGYVRYVPNLPLVEELPDDGYDPRENVFFQIATPRRNPENRTVWTPVYQDPAGQGLMVTASTPVYGPDGEFRGVIGVDVTLASIVERILARKELVRGGGGASRGQFSFLVDSSGRLIAFPRGRLPELGIEPKAEPDPGQTLEHSLLETDKPEVARLIQRAATGEGPIASQLQIDGDRHLIAMDRVASTGWILGRVVSETSLTAGVLQARRAIGRDVGRLTGSLSAITLALLLTALLAVVGYVIFYLVQPLRRLAQATDALRQGSYGIHVPAERNDELGRTGQAFNELSDRLAGLIQDLEARVAQRTAEAEASRHHFQSLLENSPVGIAFLDGDRCVRQVNEAMLELFPYTEAEVLDRSTWHLYADESEYQRVGREAYPVIRTGGTYETVTELRRADGRPFPASLRGRAVNPEDLREGFIWVIQDISEQKRLEAELDHQASHDRLTGIYNRKRFEELLGAEIERVDRYGRPFSLIMFDIDHFKTVNDAHGHHIGDRVLVQATERVARELRHTDSLARWGGEEFMVLLPETRLEEATALAERLRTAFAEPVDPQLPLISLSLGVTEYRPGETTEELTRRLDQALYRAKNAGRNRVERI